MVSKRLYCGSNGFNGSYVPKAPRSCRKRSLLNRTEDIQMRAIDLLATLAGKLLQESESSSASTNAFEDNKQFDVDKEGKQEQEAECQKLKSESTDTGISDSKSSTENKLEKGLLNEYPSDEKVVDGNSVSGSGYLPKLKGVFTGESCDVSVANVTKQLQEETKGMGTGDLSPDNTCNSKDTMESFNRVRNQTKLAGRDVENIFRCDNFSNKFKSHKLSTYMGDRRLKKLLSSKHWKTVPKLKDVEHVRADGAPKPQYPKRKMCYGQKRYQLDSVYKKRKLSDRSSVVTSDGGFSGRTVSSSDEKSNAENEEISHHLKDSYVRLNIKSFKIPELCVEVSESTTVGSLKSAVLEAVTALLGDGIRVGVLIQGKKVRDDKKTLSQKGISCGENLDLGFTLEPGSTPTISSEDPPLLPDASSLLKRPASSPTMDSGISSSCPDSDSLTVSDNHIENNLGLVPFQLKTTEEPISDSRALVPVPAMNVESLAIVPVNQRPKRSELAQRRTRRPFSVPEVEALVQAVEEIGTGRWRDVKLRAFQNADHRTYVDLKDKWKTLVHTASIAPQQRRGQPVPQELLDRVLAAHGHWSQHQAKQQHCIDTVNRASKITDADGTQQVGILQAV